MIDRNAILDAMEAKTQVCFDREESYKKNGPRGCMVAQIQDEKNPLQWDSSQRPFGEISAAPGTEDTMIINNGANFEGTVMGKIAYTRRTGKNSGVHYYEVLGNESWWKGAVSSADGKCICGFSGLMGKDDVEIAEAGIAEYERQKNR